MYQQEVMTVRQPVMDGLLMEAYAQLHIDRINSLPFGHPENWHKLDNTFSPIHKWLAKWEATGEIDVIDDIAIFQPDKNVAEVYPLADALLYMCEIYELVAQDLNITDQTGNLRELAQLIADGSMVCQDDTDKARKTLAWMRDVSKKITPNQYSDYAVAIQTRALLAAAGQLQKVADIGPLCQVP